MLSDKTYARFFGDSLLEEIFHLDEELTQVIANKQDPAIEDELEHSLEVALSEAEIEGNNILLEAKKKTPKFHVYSAFGGAKLSSHHTEAAAHKAAARHSNKQPVHVWTAEGGEMGMGKPIAHYNKGEKTVYEEFEVYKTTCSKCGSKYKTKTDADGNLRPAVCTTCKKKAK